MPHQVFHLEQTHFSAHISLKNSMIKDRPGFPLNPLPHNDSENPKTLKNENNLLLKKTSTLETKVNDLEAEVTQSEVYRDTSEKQINSLKASLKHS